MTTQRRKKGLKNYSYVGFFLITTVSFFYLFLNIIYSQNISPIYSSFSDEEKISSVLFLKTIRPLPEFNELLLRYKNIFGKSIIKLVYADEWQRKSEIEKLNMALEKNPKARDVLLVLSTLYEEGGNKLKAAEFLKKARDIDPSL